MAAHHDLDDHRTGPTSESACLRVGDDTEAQQFGGDGVREEKSLGELAAQGGDAVAFGGGLDAFSHDRETQRAGQGQGGLHDGRRSGVMVDTGDEGAVELEPGDLVQGRRSLGGPGRGRP